MSPQKNSHFSKQTRSIATKAVPKAEQIQGYFLTFARLSYPVRRSNFQLVFC